MVWAEKVANAFDLGVGGWACVGYGFGCIALKVCQYLQCSLNPVTVCTVTLETLTADVEHTVHKQLMSHAMQVLRGLAQVMPPNRIMSSGFNDYLYFPLHTIISRHIDCIISQLA